MRKLIFALCLTLLIGIMTYLTLSGSNFRLMSLDDSLKHLNALMHQKVVPTSLTELNFKNTQAELEFQAICSGLSVGFLVWFVIFILHRIQIFFVDITAFLPLKK